MTRTHRLPLAILVLGAVFAARSPCQCAPVVSALAPAAKPTGNAFCSVAWDPDGAGPLPELLVIGGIGLTAGSGTAFRQLMTWNGSEWRPLASDPSIGFSQVSTLTIWNGMLIAGGDFAGDGCDHVGAWDGTTWQPLGGGLPRPVSVLQTHGNLLVAATSGATGGQEVFTFDGVTWTALPLPPLLEQARAMISYNGMLCVAGARTTQPVGVLERWNGTTWLAPTLAQNTIRALSVRPSLAVGGTPILYAGGAFTQINGTNAAFVASSSDGAATVWTQVANGLPASCGACIALHVRPVGLTGTGILASTFHSGTLQLTSTGTNFIQMGLQHMNSLVRYAGGFYGTPSGFAGDSCFLWGGVNWDPVPGLGLLTGFTSGVFAASQLGDDMVVGGTFPAIDGVTVNNVARWDGTGFAPLGAGLSGSTVAALLTLDDGNVIAGGDFTASGITPVARVARWNGSTWSQVGLDLGGKVQALARMPNGDLIAGGTFSTATGAPGNRIARFDGTAWVAFGTGMNGEVAALSVRGDGVLFAGGAFTLAGGNACAHIAQWDGSTWQPVAAGCDGDVKALAVRPNGDVVAAGAFAHAGGVFVNRCARWTGTAWLSMGALGTATPAPRALAVLPDGDVVAGRGFHQASPIDAGLSRWDGVAWAPYATQLGGITQLGVSVRVVAQRANGDVLVGGEFWIADGQANGGLVLVSPTCPASLQPYGAGCSSAVGPLSIHADAPAWIGTPLRTTTTGVAPNALCLGLIGFSSLSIPLDLLLAEGQPGCSLLASSEIAMLLLPAAGVAHVVLPLADDLALVGATVFAQTIPLEFDGFGALAAVRGSDALAITIGAM